MRILILIIMLFLSGITAQTLPEMNVRLTQLMEKKGQHELNIILLKDEVKGAEISFAMASQQQYDEYKERQTKLRLVKEELRAEEDMYLACVQEIIQFQKRFNRLVADVVGFHGVAWGASRDSVARDNISKQLVTENDDLLCYADTLFSNSIYAVFFFDTSAKLNFGKQLITTEFSELSEYEACFQQIADSIAMVFGQPTVNEDNLPFIRRHIWQGIDSYIDLKLEKGNSFSLYLEWSRIEE
jgi:hypothetical protein